MRSDFVHVDERSKSGPLEPRAAFNLKKAPFSEAGPEEPNSTVNNAAINIGSSTDSGGRIA